MSQGRTLTTQEQDRLLHALRIAHEQLDRDVDAMRDAGRRGDLLPHVAEQLAETFEGYAQECHNLIALFGDSERLTIGGGE